MLFKILMLSSTIFQLTQQHANQTVEVVERENLSPIVKVDDAKVKKTTTLRQNLTPRLNENAIKTQINHALENRESNQNSTDIISIQPRIELTETQNVPRETIEESINENVPRETIEQPININVPRETIEESINENVPRETIEESVNENVPRETIEESVNENVPRETIEQPVNENVPHETIEQPVNENVPRETIEQPVNENVPRETIEQPISENVPRETIEQPVNENVPRETIEQPVNENVPRETIEESINENVPRETIEQPVNENVPRETIEQPVNENVPRETIEQPISENVPRETIEQPINENVPRETIEENVQPETTSIDYASGDLLTNAAKYVGTPYVWGGKTPDGFDCSGFTQHVFKETYGIDIGGWTVPQESSGTQISVEEAQAGDLYFWGDRGSTYHVAIATGGGNYIHAAQPGTPLGYGSNQYFTPDFAVRVNF